MKCFLVATLLGLSFCASALEIDEKLTVRLLRLSASKKTVLLNRGLEDGLVVGDHAKFYLTTGVVARGVVQKVSPTRSIWSVYRIVDGDVIRTDQVLNIKISPPVKLTDDPSQSFIAQSTVLDQETGIPLAEGANDIAGADLSQEEAGEFATVSVGDSAPISAPMRDGGFPAEAPMSTSGEVVVRSGAGMSPTRTIDVFGLAHFNALSTTTDLGEEGGTSSGSDSSIAFSLGLEKYFNRQSGFLRDLSLFGFIHSANNTSTSASGAEVSSSAFEYGAGVNYHFLAPPLAYHSLIAYVGLAFGIGTTEDSLTLTDSSAEAQVLSGSSNFLSFGGGIKYYLPNGFGMRAYLDYYRRGETYALEDEEGEYTKVVSGPRFQVGLSYRF